MDKLYTTTQAAELLGKKMEAVQVYARRHKIGQKIGRDILFTPEDIERLRAAPPPGRPKQKKEDA